MASRSASTFKLAFWVLALGAFTLVSILASRHLGRRPSPPVLLRSGLELRVAKVSFDTRHEEAIEPSWKWATRRVLPSFLQTPLGLSAMPSRFTRPHPTLAVFLHTVDPKTDRVVPTSINDVQTRLAHGFWTSGHAGRAVSGSVMVEFPCYQRAAHTLPLRLKVGGEQINLEVHNPQPIEPSVWAAHPLPQTNIVNGYRYAFTKRWGSRVAIGVRRNVPHAPALGWCSMRLTTVDPWGNWQAGRPGRLGSGLFFPILPTQSGVWKLLTETDEYLSAGLMGEGPDNLHHVMPLNSRLRELGVQLVLFTSGGAFAITNASLPTATPAGWVAATNDFVTLRPVRGNGDWLVSLATRQPAILLVADAEIPLRARLRERIGADDGRIFRTYEIARHTARIQGRVWSATLYNPHVPSDARSLEVEIIHRLPQAEFYIYQDF